MALKTKSHKTQTHRTPKNEHSAAVEAKKTQTFTHHIRELRRRLFSIVLASIVVGSLVYYYHDFFIKLVMAPLGGQKLVYLTPVGGFSFIFMVTFYVTMLLVLPFILYQVYAFLKPAIPRHTSRLSLQIGLAATVLMGAGASFGYFVAVPAGLEFLNGFASDYVTATLTADSYLNFVLGYILGIGILFELPLLLLFWHWIHPLTPGGLLNSERFVIVGAFIAAAILSPSPDALSQTIIAVPIIIVYQFGVIAVLISIRKARNYEKKRAKIANIRVSTPVISGPHKEREAPRKLASKPVVAAYPLRQRQSVSMDGFVKPKKPSIASKKSVSQPASSPSPAPKRPRQSLVVPRRSQVISDFGPVRRPAVDTNR